MGKISKKMKTIEQNIYNKIDNFLKSEFSKISSENYYNITYNNDYSENSYFSEIEIDFLKNDNIIDIYSILIYIDNNLQAPEQELIDYSVKDLKEILREKY